MQYSTQQRIAAIARLVVTLAVTVAAAFGLTIDPEALLTVVLCALALAGFAWSWWKNANISQAAIDAQEFLDAAKEGKDVS